MAGCKTTGTKFRNIAKRSIFHNFKRINQSAITIIRTQFAYGKEILTHFPDFHERRVDHFCRGT